MSKAEYINEIIKLLEMVSDESLLHFIYGFLEKQI